MLENVLLRSSHQPGSLIPVYYFTVLGAFFLFILSTLEEKGSIFLLKATGLGTRVDDIPTCEVTDLKGLIRTSHTEGPRESNQP